MSSSSPISRDPSFNHSSSQQFSSPIICTNAILLPPTINQLKRNVRLILKEQYDESTESNELQVGNTDSDPAIQQLIQSHPFDSVYNLESFFSDFEYRNVLQEAWSGKNVSFVFHGGATEMRRRKILFSANGMSGALSQGAPTKDLGASSQGSSLPFILKVSETILKQMRLKSDKFSSSRYKMEISMLELYKNKVFDVLYPMNAENFSKSSQPGGAAGLSIHSHAKYGSYCPSCANFRVRSMLEIRKLLELGMRERPSKKLYQQENGLDPVSKSDNLDWDEILDAPPVTHLVFQIVLTQTTFDFSKQNPATEIISKISIIDVGGKVVAPGKASSVSVPTTSSNQSPVDAWLDQSNNILATVVQRLSMNQTSGVSTKNASSQNGNDASYVPFRDSNLTLLLKDQLGGNCVTTALLCMGATEEDKEQIESSFEFAHTLSTIHNRPSINRYKNDAILSEIEEHATHLEEQISSAIVHDDKYKTLKDELEQERELMTVLKKSPKERMLHFAKRRKLNVSEMLKSGISISAFGDVLEYDTSAVPYLLNMKSYISTFEKLVYFLTQSTVSLGSSDDNDIVLTGKGIKIHHALLRRVINEYDEEQVIVDCIQNAPVFINGEEVNSENPHGTRLNTGDRLILGEHIFQYSHPRFPLSPQAENDLLLGQVSPKKQPTISPSSNGGENTFHLDVSGEDTLPLSLVGWERAKRELIAKRTVALDSEIKKRENTLQKLVQEILIKEDQFKHVEQNILKVQVQLESTEKLVEEKSESTKQMQTKLKEYQKYYSNIKSQEAMLLKEIHEHKEELEKLEEEARVTRKNNRKEMELKAQLSTELTMMKQEQKMAVDARYEFQKAKEYHEQQLQKSKELELEVRDKSLALTQKVLDIREKNIILRQKAIEIQQKDIAVRERDVALQEKTIRLEEVNTLLQQKSAESEKLQDEFIKYDKQFQEFLRYKSKKEGGGCLPFGRRKKRVQSNNTTELSTPSGRNSATFKSSIVNSSAR